MKYTLIRSRRKTLCVQITAAGEVLVRAPKGISDRSIERFLTEKADWIASRQAVQKERAARATVLSSDELAELTRQAQTVLPALTAVWAEKMGVSPAAVRIGHAARRYGSCSSAGVIRFSCRVMLVPEDARTYIVVHELAHLRQMNHSAAFYAEIARVMPDYKARIRSLRIFEHLHPFETA